MTPTSVSLGEFLKQLTLKIREQNQPMPFADEQPWHLLFYKLKKEGAVAGKPSFLDGLFFDWNGNYPRSQDLSDYIHALHYTGCVTAANPHYERIDVNPAVAEIWKQATLGEGLDGYLTHAAELATREFAIATNVAQNA